MHEYYTHIMRSSMLFNACAAHKGKKKEWCNGAIGESVNEVLGEACL